MPYETRGPKALSKIETRSVEKQPNFIVNVTRDDGKPVTEADFIRCLDIALKKRIKAEAKRAGENVLKQIEWLKDNRPELYRRFSKGESLDVLLDEIEGEKRLIKAVRDGVLK